MCVGRSYLRLRDTLSKDCNSLVQRMQKALTEMNVQIHPVISDITGLTGMSILRAIVAGERDCIKLAQMGHPQSRAAHKRLPKPWKAITARNTSLPCRQHWNFTTAFSSKLWSVIDVSKRPLLLLKRK